VLRPLDAATDAARATAEAAVERAAFALMAGVAALLAFGFATLAGFVALSRAVGPVAAALIFAALWTLLAAGLAMAGRARARRRRLRALEAQARLRADAASLAALSAGPLRRLAPLAALAIGIALGARR
jgi:type VI protein secretion system component VasK